MSELRSSGVGPWLAGKIATITIELMGQQMTFLNGGSAQALTPAFSYSVACKDKPRSTAGTSCLKVASPWPAAG